MDNNTHRLQINSSLEVNTFLIYFINILKKKNMIHNTFGRIITDLPLDFYKGAAKKLLQQMST